MFKNEQQIAKIVAKGHSHNFCPLGNAHYTNQFTIELRPNEIIPDYLEIKDFIAKELNDKALIIEDAVAILFDYVMDTFQPFYLKVSSLVTDAAHPEVLVEKEGFYND